MTPIRSPKVRARSFAEYPAELDGPQVLAARRLGKLRRLFGETSHPRKRANSADFSAKQGSAFCARGMKDRTRDNASRSARKDTEAIMIGAIIEFDDLRKISRLGERAQLTTVERWAQRAGISYRYDGRGGIWTTLDAINAALGVTRESQPEIYSVDKVL